MRRSVRNITRLCTGTLVIDIKFDDATYFRNGLAWVEMGSDMMAEYGIPSGKMGGYINKKGDYVWKYVRKDFKNGDKHDDMKSKKQD